MDTLNTRTHKITNLPATDRLKSGRNLSPGLFIWVYLYNSYMIENLVTLNVELGDLPASKP